jgi:flagellar export protein FliJ
MSQFHFRLATLLRLRQSTRDERRVELAEVQRADAELEGQLTRLAARQERLRGECRKAAGPGEVDLARLAESHQYAALLQTQEDELVRQRLALAIEIDRRRQSLLEADREVRTLEKLRENQIEAHRQNKNRQEIKRLDEAALLAAER